MVRLGLFRGAKKNCKHVCDLKDMELPFEREEDEEET
jgi:hypothetical protein